MMKLCGVEGGQPDLCLSGQGWELSPNDQWPALNKKCFWSFPTLCLDFVLHLFWIFLLFWLYWLKWTETLSGLSNNISVDLTPLMANTQHSMYSSVLIRTPDAYTRTKENTLSRAVYYSSSHHTPGVHLYIFNLIFEKSALQWICSNVDFDRFNFCLKSFNQSHND